MKVMKEKQLYNSIKQLIEESKSNLAITVNASMSLLYWNIGKKINDSLAKRQGSIYGKNLVSTLCQRLLLEFGSSFLEKNIRRMMQFAKVFHDEENVVSLIRHLSWTHILAIIPIEDPLKREFYIQMCILENWNVRVFRERIQSLLYERTAISKKPELVIKNELELSGHLFKKIFPFVDGIPTI
jgi:DUF1016 N-terminal domain